MDVLKLRSWYRTSTGQMVRRIVQGYINDFWPEMVGWNILIIGYGAPYAGLWNREGHVFMAMPAQMGATHWPDGAPNCSLLSWDTELPFEDNFFDGIFIAHSLEFSANDEKVMAECFRILKPESGRLLALTPNRAGAWCRREISPLAWGRPYSSGQVARLMRKSDFIVTNSCFGLFTPPSEMGWVQKYWEKFEKFGAYWRAPLGGVILTEAKKDLFGGRVIRATSGKKPRIVTEGVGIVATT